MSKFGRDDRAVSTTVNYVLALAITSLLVSGLLVAAGGFLDTQRRTVSRDELRVAGDQLAGAISKADRLAAVSTGGEVRVRTTLPDRVAGAFYTLRTVEQSAPPGTPNRTTIVVESEGADVSVNVTVRTSVQVAERTVDGGTVVVTHRDTDGDGRRELVVGGDELALSEAGPTDLGHDEVVFVDGDTGELSSVAPDGTVTRYGVGSVQAIGPKEVDFDGDGLREIPYVTSAGEVKLVDEAGERQLLATGAETAKTRLGVGEWKGRFRVFYASASGHEVFRVSLGEAAQQVDDGGADLHAYAIAGVMDFNGDGDDDVVYTGSSQQVHYIDDGGQSQPNNGGVGQNNGIGVGGPRDFDGDGSPRIPLVGGSNNVALYDNSSRTSLTGSAAKTPLAGIEWNASIAGVEIVYVDSSDDTLYYVAADGTSRTQIVAADGDPIAVDTSVGVA